MELGDIPAWVACAFAAAAFVVSLKARGDGKRSANASQTSADASVRSAAAAEEALALQRQEVEQRRAAEEEAARPRPDLKVEFVRDRQYALQNQGTGPASKVTVLDRGLPPMVNNIPVDVDLEPGESHLFLMVGTMGGPVPPQIYVTWDGQEDPVPLPVPPRR